jgi:hypothetical protein
MRVVRLYPEGLRLEGVELPVPREGEVLVGGAYGRDHTRRARMGSSPSAGSAVARVVGRRRRYRRASVCVDAVRSRRTTPSYVGDPRGEPRNLTRVEAALPMGGLSAWQALFVHGRLQPDERISSPGRLAGSDIWRCSSRGMPAQSSSRTRLQISCSILSRRSACWRAHHHDRRAVAGCDVLHRRARSESAGRARFGSRKWARWCR